MNISTALNTSKLLIVAIVVSGISLFTTSCNPEIVEIVNPIDCDSTSTDSTFEDNTNPNDSSVVNDGDNTNDSTWVDPGDSTIIGGGTYPGDSTGTNPGDSTGFGG